MDLQEKCDSFVKNLLEELGIKDIDELSLVRKNVLTMINESFNAKIDGQPEVFSYIAADNAVVEVVDDETGLCFRRELPFRYEETGNGVSLIGEDIYGAPSQLSFLSEAAYEKLKDLTGSGPDAPLCKDHDHGGHEPRPQR